MDEISHRLRTTALYKHISFSTKLEAHQGNWKINL